MKNKKIIFLFLALLLPASVFVFLKIFGRNEFQVPVMYQEGEMIAPPICAFSYAVPYTIPDSLFSILGLNRNDSLFVFYFDRSLNIALHRVSVEFDGAPVFVVNPTSLHVYTYGRLLRDCILLMGGDSSLALVDHRRRIRGYYNASNRDELDRLIVEMKIILKQY